MSAPATIGDLVGLKKAPTDLTTRRIKERYTLSTEIRSGQFTRFTLPNIGPNSMLDARDIMFRFNLNFNSTDANCTYDAPDPRCLISKMRILSGSTVLADIVAYDLLCVFQTKMETNTSTENGFSLESQGKIFDLATRQAKPNGSEYCVKLGPKGTLLNGSHVIQTSRVAPIHIELYWNPPNRCLYSASDGSADYYLTNSELLLTYLQSNSVAQFVASNPVDMHLVDFSHRYNPMPSAQNNIRISSSSKSLRSVTSILRVEANLSSIDYQGKFENYYSGANHDTRTLLVNSVLAYEEEIDTSTTEDFQQVVHAHPALLTSSQFGNFDTTEHFVADNLRSARHFDQLLSGVDTSQHQTDLIQRVKFTGIPASPVRADSFVTSDVRVYCTGALMGEMKLEY